MWGGDGNSLKGNVCAWASFGEKRGCDILSNWRETGVQVCKQSFQTGCLRLKSVSGAGVGVTRQ